MGLFDKLFGRSEDHAANAAFEKLYRVMTNEAVQNASYPAQLQELMASRGGADLVPDAQGEFGRSATSPIPVNGPFGELIYISSLRAVNGSEVLGHRLGSIGRRDVYETASMDGSSWDVLYFDPYYQRKSRAAPATYRIAAEAPKFLMAVNVRVLDFPRGMVDSLRECTARMLGIAMVAPALKSQLQAGRLDRPASQRAALASLRLDASATAG